jgi:hypothetical protein
VYTRALLGLNGCTYAMAYRNLILHVRYDHTDGWSVQDQRSLVYHSLEQESLVLAYSYATAHTIP